MGGLTKGGGSNVQLVNVSVPSRGLGGSNITALTGAYATYSFRSLTRYVEESNSSSLIR